MSALSNLVIPFTGGAANAEFNSSAGQAETLNYNPIFSVGSGTITASPSNTATQSPTASTSGLLSPYPAGQGLATLGTAYPGSAAAASAAAPISSSMLLLILAAVALMLIMPEGGKR